MVERDIGDHADSRLDHVGGIQAPAHADFEHRDVHLPAREMLEGNRREHLEKAGMPGQFALADQAFGSTIDHIVDQGKIVVADLLPVDPYALVDPYQVGRGIKPGPRPRSLQNRSQGRCGRTLAVRPRNQNTGEIAARDCPAPPATPACAPDRTCARASGPARGPARTCGRWRFRRTEHQSSASVVSLTTRLPASALALRVHAVESSN